MNIYIDESGNFSEAAHYKSPISCIGALCVPRAQTPSMERGFHRLKQKLGLKETEVKGSRLDPEQIFEFLVLLSKRDAIFFGSAFDIHANEGSHTTKFKEVQAQKLLDAISPQHNKLLIAELEEAASQMKVMANQLFVQGFILVELLIQVLQWAPNYYSLRSPKELAEFNWTMDSKGEGKIPPAAEALWKKLLVPMAMTTDKELSLLDVGDFSHFGTFMVGSKINWGEVLRRNFAHADSRDHIGLQLVDVVTNALRRALNGHLPDATCRQLGRIIVRRPTQCIQIVKLTLDPDQKGGRPSIDPRVIRQIEANTKNFIPFGMR